MFRTVVKFKDREIIKKCGLDAYFFLRYLKTLLIIFVPICGVLMPTLIPINYVGGIGKDINGSGNSTQNATEKRATGDDTKETNSTVTGLDTLAWGNVSPHHTDRYAAHLVMAILVVIWVCAVFFFELKAYIKVRQDYLTSAEHRLRASATTVLVSSIPEKWLSEEALSGLFDVLPGGVRNIWLNRDLTKLLDKVNERDNVHSMLENAETELIKAAKKAQLKQKKSENKKQHKSLNRKERAVLNAEEDAKAKTLAESGEGKEAGEDEVPHTVADGIIESQMDVHEGSPKKERIGLHIPNLHLPAQGIKNITGKAGKGVDETLGTTNGFNVIAEPDASASRKDKQTSSPIDSHLPQSEPAASRAQSMESTTSTSAIRKEPPYGVAGNTVRKLEKEEDMYSHEDPKFWEFWKPPAGGYASPVPQGFEADDYLAAGADKKEKTTWQTIKGFIPFMGDDEEPFDYVRAYTEDADKLVETEDGIVWKKYLKTKHRPTHHLPLFGVNWLFGVPWITKKVDTIYWCRQELARLNLEIEEDQKHPDRYPLLNSAFVQFNHQIAAHMACQSVVHHIPRQMAPRMSEIAPRDVIWDNMATTWWQEALRTAIVVTIVCAMIVLWAIPVSLATALFQVDQIVQDASWLAWLRRNEDVEKLVKAIAGVLPAAITGILLALVPLILVFLGGLRGVKTGSSKNEFVQKYYFVFLFVQLFLVVAIVSFFTASIDKFISSLQELESIQNVLQLLARNLPKAANYFFSYMILQALTTSSGTLLQIGGLFMWFIMGPMFDSTARNKWQRNTNLNNVRWGSFFPVYTNFACIALIYCIIAPLITIFAVITFGLLWVAQKYAMVYIYRFETDTGGVLYPRAINQTFTGLYVMELCLAGLFYIARNEKDEVACATHGTIMIVVFILTIIYQYFLNRSFSPLFRYLPITLEDEAVLRDEAFQRAQDHRLGLADEEDNEPGSMSKVTSPGSPRQPMSPGSRHTTGNNIEMDELHGDKEAGAFNPVRQVGTWAKVGGRQVGEWAKDGGNQLLKMTFMDRDSVAAEYRRQQRKKDSEAQRAMGDALYGGMHDEIEDLTPDERDMLTRHAFMHSALRARRPTVWIPRDDMGISDDEIRQTKEFSEYIWISNEGTALDSKQRVIYGKNPPDFSEVDVINL